MRFDSLASVLAFAGIVVAAPTCTIQTAGGSTENGVLNKNCCTDLTVIFARGTAELGNVGSVAGPPFFAALRQKLGNNRVTVQGVDYPASIAGLTTNGASGGPTLASLIETAKAQCPNTQIIASGYSQGASVVHNGLSSPSISSLVSGAVLFGDPSNGTGVGNLSRSKVKEFCAAGDLVCTSGIYVVTAPHLSYGANAQDAASFVLSTLGL